MGRYAAGRSGVTNWDSGSMTASGRGLKKKGVERRATLWGERTRWRGALKMSLVSTCTHRGLVGGGGGATLSGGGRGLGVR